ncbi:MAG: SpoIIE family protein phosphatase [Bacteroidia bacterium]|nr:SpoIIE family protein phosphatase [Bacteroidia bacterium]
MRLIPLFLFLALNSHALNVIDSITGVRIDSLNLALQNAGSDRERMDLHKMLQYTWYNYSYDSGMVHCKKGLDLAVKLGSIKTQAFFLRRIGVFYNQKYDYSSALEYYFKALDASEKAGVKEDLGWCHNNIANVYSSKYEISHVESDLDKSLEHMTAAVNILKEMESRGPYGAALSNLGNKLMQKKEYDLAIQKFKIAVEIFETINDGNGKMMNYENLGNAYLSKGEIKNDFILYSEAMTWYEKVIRASGPNASDGRYARVLAQVSRIYILMGFHEKAKQYLDKSLEISMSLDDKHLLRDVYSNFVHYYEHKGDFKQAFLFQNKLLSIKDSLISSESMRSMNQAQAFFDSEKLKKQNEILEKDKNISNLELKRKNLILFSTIGGMILLGLIALLFINRSLIRKRANKQLSEAFNTITIQNKNITDSITYAKRIQDAFVTNEEKLRSIVADSAVLYLPLHIVSGDFCWSAEVDGKKVVVVADCTGHGVPGAFMSMIGNTVLKDTVIGKKILSPALILQSLHESVVSALNQKGDDLSSQADGMDVSVCVVDPNKQALLFAGANNGLVYVNGEGVEKIDGDVYSVGGIFSSRTVSYTEHSIPSGGKTFYLFTDGLVDQFGGREDKKFSYARLTRIIGEQRGSSPEFQRDRIREEFEQWMGQGRQTDDVLLVVLRP